MVNCGSGGVGALSRREVGGVREEVRSSCYRVTATVLITPCGSGPTHVTSANTPQYPEISIYSIQINTYSLSLIISDVSLI